MTIKKFYRCKNCLMVSTRPRTNFVRGVCSACINFAERKKINWKQREKTLWNLCNKIRKKNGDHDIIVPVGGGKDSSYVAWVLKHKFKMNPLCVFCEPPMFTELGQENLNNFEKAGFDVLRISQNEHYRKMEKICFTESGLPQNNWLALITVAPMRIAKNLKIKMIMWGEDGESMYGGNNSQKNKINPRADYFFKTKVNNNSLSKYIKKNNLDKKNYFWSNIEDNEIKQFSSILKCHWSYFEKWDEEKHLKLAKKFCGHKNLKKKQQASLNDHSHTDQRLYSLHMYLAYLKFGFGRATTDVSIGIRHKKYSKKQGIQLINKNDSIFPTEFLNDYLNYFKINKSQFFKILKKFVNKDLFKINKKKIVFRYK